MSFKIATHPLVQAVQHTAQQRRLPILLVGGAVRDALLGVPPADFDFAVLGNPVPLARAVADQLGADFWLMDAVRGTARVLVAAENQPKPIMLDFARGRGTTWEDDLRDRDFTINAIGLDLANGSLIDPTGGQADLANLSIRAASAHALADDPVRTLRAVRLAHQLGFTIEPDTLAQIRTHGPALPTTSAERARDELLTILNVPDVSRAVVPAVRQLDALGLLQILVPEVGPMRTCEQSPPHQFAVLEHTFWVMDALANLMERGAIDCGAIDCGAKDSGSLHLEPVFHAKLRAHFQMPTANTNRQAVFMLAALLHDNAKPITRQMNDEGKLKFPQHEAVGAPIAAARAQALRLSSDEVQIVRTVARHHGQANALLKKDTITSRDIYNFMRIAGDCVPELALFASADCYGKRGDRTKPTDCAPNLALTHTLLEQYDQHYAVDVAPPPFITGKDLLALGLPAGKNIGAVLEAVREAQMTGELHSREDALALAQTLSQLHSNAS